MREAKNTFGWNTPKEMPYTMLLEEVLSLKDCKLYVPWAPCTDCARGIIQTGISKVVIHQNGQDFYDAHTNGKWVDATRRTMSMFEEAGVEVEYIESDIVIPEIYMNAKMYDAAVYLNKSGDSE